ncbi:hypothetical protein F4782DRAFT_463864 [Xylaria castorea]|nr:hypothetical protein F4782DRAFT_463864 [Xylaria castorea]
MLELVIEPLTDWLKRHKLGAHYKQLEWASNSTMQLQRLAHEESGYGNWSNTTGLVPITKYGEELGALHVQGASNPVLANSQINTLMALSQDTTEVQLSSSVRVESPVGKTLGSESTQEEHNFQSGNDLPGRVSSVPVNGSPTIGREDSDGTLEAHANSIVERAGTT